MATGLEIAACDVTSTAQVDPNPVVAVSPWRSECGRHKHLDIAINICKYPSHPGGTCPSPGYMEFTAGTAEVSGPSCRYWGLHPTPLCIGHIGVQSCSMRLFSPMSRLGAQVFSSSGWWCPSCPSCSSNSSYSCSIACERGEISKQLGHHFFFLEMDRRPGRFRFGFGLVIFVWFGVFW